jgi:hypothetical protein
VKSIISDQRSIINFAPENKPFPLHVFKPDRIGNPSLLIRFRIILDMDMQMWEKSIP